jgi:hypothetical protein
MMIFVILGLWIFGCCVVTLAKIRSDDSFFKRLAQTIWDNLKLVQNVVSKIFSWLYLEAKNRENELQLAQLKPISPFEVTVVENVLKDFFINSVFVEQVLNYDLKCCKLSFISNGLKCENTTPKLLVMALHNAFQKKIGITREFGVHYDTSGTIDVFIR